MICKVVKFRHGLLHVGGILRNAGTDRLAVAFSWMVTSPPARTRMVVPLHPNVTMYRLREFVYELPAMPERWVPLFLLRRLT